MTSPENVAQNTEATKPDLDSNATKCARTQPSANSSVQMKKVPLDEAEETNFVKVKRSQPAIANRNDKLGAKRLKRMLRKNKEQDSDAHLVTATDQDLDQSDSVKTPPYALDNSKAKKADKS